MKARSVAHESSLSERAVLRSANANAAVDTLAVNRSIALSPLVVLALLVARRQCTARSLISYAVDRTRSGWIEASDSASSCQRAITIEW